MTNSPTDIVAPVAPRRWFADAVRWAVAALLLVATGLKTWQFATEPVNNCAAMACRWHGIVEVQLEILLGLWLLSGIAKAYARAMAMLAFAAFSCVTLYKGLHGDASCGCFGKVELSPWYSLGIDLTALLCLALARPGPGRAPGRGRLVATCVTAVVLAAASIVAMVTYRPARLLGDGTIAGRGAVLLDPTGWTGRRWPLLSHVRFEGPRARVEDNLSAGRWRIVLYRSDCLACRRELAELESRLRSTVSRPGPPTMAVELPPRAPVERNPLTPDSPIRQALLDDSRPWFVATPLEVDLADGIVVRVRQAHSR